MSVENVLMIFVKYPEVGKVKTRLAKALGDDTAARLHRHMAEDIIHRLKRCHEYRTVVFFHPPGRESDMREWLGGDLYYIRQSGQDLGERLANAFNVVLRSGARHAVVIGSDCPDVSQEVVMRAFQHLNENDVVIGPARDGGYYLLGLSRYIPGVFSSIDWSTERVFNQTIERVRELNLSFTILEALGDVDEPSDLPRAIIESLRLKTWESDG